MSASIHRTYNRNHIESIAKQMQCVFFLSQTHMLPLSINASISDYALVQVFLDKYLFKYDILQKYSYFWMDAVYTIS